MDSINTTRVATPMMMSSPRGSAAMQRVEKIMEEFFPTPEQLQACFKGFLGELRRGLEMHKKNPNDWHPSWSALMMLDSCVSNVPTGREKGVYYAVDFGGTNLRAVRVHLDGEGNAVMKQLKHNLRNVKVPNLSHGLLDRHATASMLFDEIASVVRRLMKEEGDLGKNKKVEVGFTYSFSMSQRSLNQGISLSWSKGFETGIESNDPVIGRDVCALLNNAFDRAKINARTCAVLNDTVGALLAGNYAKTPAAPPCLVGVILGTGMNGAYMQPGSSAFGYQGVLMNTELGGFNVGLPLTNVDYELDFESSNRGRQLFEKMCSGMYIGEVCRLLIRNAFEHETPPAAWKQQSLDGETCSKIYNDVAPYQVTTQLLLDLFNWKIPDGTYATLVHRLVSAAMNRSAALAAVAVAAMARATGRLQPAMGGISVGIDGALYLNNPPYQKQLRTTLECILGKQRADLIQCVVAEDGSGKGAAILAATVAAAS